jgi:xylan 1,4-beta-xylosidase
MSAGLMALGLAAGAVRAWGDESAARQLSIDATVTIGALRPLNGVQAEDAQGAAFYRTAHVDLVRIPDATGAGDIDAIFPDLNADVDNPKSYNFGPTDRLVGSIKSSGAEPLFRIGRSANAAGEPPADLDKWALIVRHVVLHYNAGWGRGFRYGIRYWEIWNAPDAKQFWSGTAAEYYRLYDKTARAIQAADPNALVGGPAISRPLIAGDYREKFIDFVRLNRLPLDFFSWHFYAVDSNDPYVFVTIARQLRTILDAHGFGSAKNVLDEWNADPTDPVDPADEDSRNAGQATFAASSLIYMLGGPIDAQTYHRAAASVRTGRGAADAVGSALGAFGALKSTPLLIRSTGGDDSGFAVVAGRSKDNRLVQILISNYQVASKYLHPRDNWDTSLPERRTLQYSDNGGYDATVSLPAPGKYEVKRYRLSDSSSLALLDQHIESGPSIHLQSALPPPAVELIVISAK